LSTRNKKKKTYFAALQFIEYQNSVVNNVTLFPLEHLLPKQKDVFFRFIIDSIILQKPLILFLT